MSPNAKQEYLRAVYYRYQDASRPQKKLILDELCEVCHFHRKHAIRLINRFHPFLKPKKKSRGRMPVYKKLVRDLIPEIIKKNMACRQPALFKTP